MRCVCIYMYVPIHIRTYLYWASYGPIVLYIMYDVYIYIYEPTPIHMYLYGALHGLRVSYMHECEFVYIHNPYIHIYTCIYIPWAEGIIHA